MADEDGDIVEPAHHNTKRLILCCDGTWMNSDNGYEKGGLLGGKGTLQVPSNVTRISRCFKRRCSDGKLQIIQYECGVGTGSNTLDSVTGGAFGLGLTERVRAEYSFLCANYATGDEIFLVGFSRGAFTARSIAGMVAQLGLLTREGIDHFYPIFKDMQNWMNPDYKDQFPDIPFSNKPKGPKAADEYRTRLQKMGYTRVTQKNGELIKIKAVCVWDTVGSLGVPRTSWLDKMHIRASNDDTFKWTDTALSDRIEHAFHALALDEHRPPFSPAVWERSQENKDTTDLRQVWFPGNHGNIGGGWEDQGVSNCTLAWMMDQMASVGVEFDQKSLDRIFKQSAEFYQSQVANEKDAKTRKKKRLEWAVSAIYDSNHPQRSWGLGSINKNTSLFYWFAGQITRSPGLYKKTDPKTDLDSKFFLEDTNERIHATVRIRLACKGLGLGDKALWDCSALKNWTLKKMTDVYDDPVPRHPGWEPPLPESQISEETNGANGANGGPKQRWVWEYSGPQKYAPTAESQRILVEEPLGPYERYYLRVAGGTPNVFEYAEMSETSAK